jgi:hypothetical protein
MKFILVIISDDNYKCDMEVVISLRRSIIFTMKFYIYNEVLYLYMEVLY